MMRIIELINKSVLKQSVSEIKIYVREITSKGFECLPKKEKNEKRDSCIHFLLIIYFLNQNFLLAIEFLHVRIVV